jgi:hypothetical protein
MLVCAILQYYKVRLSHYNHLSLSLSLSLCLSVCLSVCCFVALANGVVELAVPHEFSVRLTLESPTAPWAIVDIDFLLCERGEPDGMSDKYLAVR